MRITCSLARYRTFYTISFCSPFHILDVCWSLITCGSFWVRIVFTLLLVFASLGNEHFQWHGGTCEMAFVQSMQFELIERHSRSRLLRIGFKSLCGTRTRTLKQPKWYVINICTRKTKNEKKKSKTNARQLQWLNKSSQYVCVCVCSTTMQ